MKRISFKDSGGLHLTQAVLSGRKTMTRRVAYTGKIENINTGFFTEGKNKDRLALCESNFVVAKSQYGNGDVVAIQQSYSDIGDQVGYRTLQEMPLDNAGWTNKMFVKAELMPHHIRITDVRVEWLQDISDEDCLREGVWGITKKASISTITAWISMATPLHAKPLPHLLTKLADAGHGTEIRWCGCIVLNL